jgi:hypothetical protein
MPRESEASLSVVRPPTKSLSSRLTPPPTLTADERQLFVTLVAENKHLRGSDLPFLTSFCMATTRVAKESRGSDVLKWEREVKTLMALGRTMRLTQQAMRDPKMVGRQVRNNNGAMASLLELNGDCEGKKPWESDEPDDDDAKTHT